MFVYWDEVDWDDGFMEESIAAQRSISDYDLDYYEVYCKYPNKADYELVKKSRLTMMNTTTMTNILMMKVMLNLRNFTVSICQ